MPEPITPTQNDGGAVATAPASSEGANNSTGPTSPEVAEATPVESSTASQGNTGSDDGGNGSSDGNDGRGRPSRAERRISEISKRSKEWEDLAKDSGKEIERLRGLIENPLDPSKINLQLPDYSQAASVTPEQIASDVKKAAIDAADQIVKIRLSQYLPEAFKGQDVARAQRTAVSQLKEVQNPSSRYYRPELDPDNEKYEPETDTFLAETFERVFKSDPSYTFRNLVNEHFKQRDGRPQNNTNGQADEKPKPKAPTAPRQSTSSSSQSHKPIAEMTADEYRDYLRSQK